MYYDEIFDLNDEYIHVSNAQNKELNKVKSLDKDYACVYRFKYNLNGKKIHLFKYKLDLMHQYLLNRDFL